MMGIILNYSIYKSSKDMNLYEESGDFIAMVFVFISTFLIFYKILFDIYIVYNLFKI